MGHEYNIIVKLVILLLTGYILVSVFKIELVLPSWKEVLNSISHWNYKKEKTLKREIYLYNKKKQTKTYQKYNDIIANLNLKRKGVNVTGFKFFLFCLTIITSLVVSIVLNITLFVFPLLAFIIHKLIFTSIQVRASGLKEKRENAIMDAEDLLVADIKVGFTSAVTRYRAVFSKLIREEFNDYLINISKNMDFPDALEVLTDNLGSTFNDFAEKVLKYEKNSTEGAEEVFSEVPELNYAKREARNSLNIIFNNLKIQVIIAVCAIIAFNLLMVATKPNVWIFYTNSVIGKLLILVDIGIVVFVLSYMTIIKSSDL